MTVSDQFRGTGVAMITPFQTDGEIDFKRLDQINQLVQIPLVLHGSSGIGEENLVRAIGMGIRKINLYSEIMNSVQTQMLKALQNDFGNPVKLCQAREIGIKDTLIRYLQFSGSTH